VTDYSEGVVEP